jgi:hypothetical protein
MSREGSGFFRPRRFAAGLAFCMSAALALPTGALAGGPAPGGGQGAAKGAVDDSKEGAHRQEDIRRHRTMAAAHGAAAQCLETGRSEKECQDALRKACQGIAVGRYCGMRHSH